MRRRPERTKIRLTAFDTEAVRREAEHITRCALNHGARVVTLGPLVFFSTDTGDAWMLAPGNQTANCLVRDCSVLPVRIDDNATQVGILWQAHFRIAGKAFVYVESGSGRVTSVLGYPVQDILRACAAAAY